MAALFSNASDILANHTGNGTYWPTHEEVEHFLGDPDVDHTAALALGVVSIVCGRRLPFLLAGVASASLGIWVALVVQDRQGSSQRLFGSVDLPEGIWLPIVAGIVSAAAAAALGRFAWRSALVLLTAGLVMLLALAICRLANTSPDRLFKVGVAALSAYRVVGSIVLVAAILASALLVRRFHKQMISLASALLGTLLLLSGVSYFAARLGSEAPFSLMDDLASMVSEVRSGQCDVWERDTQASAAPEQCECSDECRTDISAWLSSAVAVLVLRGIGHKLHERAAERRKRSSEEERAPLSRCAASPAAVAGSPCPEVIGTPSAQA